MTRKPPCGLFIAGTNTGVGKTHVAAALARTFRSRGERVGVYKPVLSGSRPAGQDPTPDCRDDDVVLWEAAGCPGPLADVAPQRFAAPLAPPQAAAAEGRTVDPQLLRSGFAACAAHAEIVLVEGAGGLFSPVSDQDLNADLVCDLGLPVLLVGADQLGTVHATLATWLAARHYQPGIHLLGIVLNETDVRDDGSRAWNALELGRRCAPLPVWRVRHGAVELPELADVIGVRLQTAREKCYGRSI